MANWGDVGWWPTTNTRLAAALSTIGLLVRTEAQLDERTGQETRRLYLSLEPVDPANRRGGDMTRTRAIVRMVQDGTLHQRDPQHPVLAGLAALDTRSRLINWFKTGAPHRTVPIQGGPLHHLAATDAPLIDRVANPDALPFVRVHELTIASILIVIGVPILRVFGSGGHQTIDLAATTPDGQPVSQIIEAYRRHEIPADSILISAAQTIWNYHTILEAIQNEIPTILLRKPKSRMAAVIRPDITPKGLDLVRRKFAAG